MKRWTESNYPALTGKRAVVTGAASGLGYETAAALARHGAEVVVADRNIDGGQAAAERITAATAAPLATFRAHDLADLGAIRRFAADLNADGRTLDIQVNTAGILPPLERRTTRDGFELKFGINHLGHFALTGRLLQALLCSPAPRVVTVSSLVQAWG